MTRSSLAFSIGLLAFSTFLVCSCGDRQQAASPEKVAEVLNTAKFSVSDFAEELKLILPPVDTSGDTVKLSNMYRAFTLSYQKNDYQPLWINEDQEMPLAEELFKDLDSLRFDGINPVRYQLDELRKLKEVAMSKNAKLGEVIHFDTLCTKAYLQASRDLLMGCSNAAKIDPQWHHSNDSQWNASAVLNEMALSHQYVGLDSFRSKWDVYQSLRAASRHYWTLKEDTSFAGLKNSLSMNATDSVIESVIQHEMPWLQVSVDDSIGTTAQLLKGYQYYFGQRLSGKLDSPTLRKLRLSPDTVLTQIAVNEERVRWMNQTPEPTHIIVPLALMELFLNRDGKEAMHMRTVVGKTARPTPSLNAPMVNVVINPPWGVPPTILKNDVAPGLTKSGGAYLAKKGLKAYDKNGKIVSSAAINGNNYKRYTYRQAPGERNALGVIKFNLPNKWDIYLHDTPHKEDFPNRNRAKSSGCIRLQNPRDLGEYILHEMEGNEKLTRGKIDSIVLTHNTQYHSLKKRIPVHIVYLTSYPDSTVAHLRLLDDIYKRDSSVRSQL